MEIMHLADNFLHGHNAVATIIGAIITLLGTAGAMFFVNGQNKKMWKNDIFAKQETELWFKFRDEFIDNLNEFLDELKKLEKKETLHFKENPLISYEAEYEKFKKLKTLSEKIEVYAQKDKKLDFTEVKNLISKICGFYSSIIGTLKVQSAIAGNLIEIEEEDDLFDADDGYKFIIRDFFEIKKNFISIFLAQPNLKKLPFEKIDDELIENKFIEIKDVISELCIEVTDILDEKILAHKF